MSNKHRTTANPRVLQQVEGFYEDKRKSRIGTSELLMTP